jgi:hypothetical protein
MYFIASSFLGMVAYGTNENAPGARLGQYSRSMTRLDIAWQLSSTATVADGEAAVEELASLDPEAAVSVLPAPNALFPDDAGVVIVGAVALVALARRIVDAVCRVRKRGLIVDARETPLRIVESSQLPGGTVLTIEANGTQVTYDACASTFDLVPILEALTDASR